MSRELQHAVYRFLTAEGGGGANAQAEAALQQVLRLLPQPVVPRRFAAGVLKRLGLQTSVLDGVFDLWSVRAAVTAALVTACLTLALVPAMARVFLPSVELQSVVLGAVDVGRFGLEWMVDGLGAWRWLVSFGRVFGSAATTPGGLGLLLSSTLVAALAARLLFNLTVQDRSLHNAMSLRA